MNLLDYLATEFAPFDEKPFNPVDSAVLSQFCMVRAEGVVPALRERSSFLDLGTIVENLLSPARSAVRFADALRAELYPSMFTGLDPHRVKENLLALAASPRFRDMRVRDYLSLFDTDRQTQFAAMTFVHRKDFAYVGFRGTDTSFTGWRENFNMAYTAPVPAQEQPGALGAVEPLVPGHGDEGRTQLPEGQGQAAGGLGGVPDEGHPPLAAQGGDRLNGQNKAEHVGHVGVHHRVHLRRQLPPEGLQGGLPVKEGALGRFDGHVRDGPERPGHRVVLIAGDEHGAPRLHQGFEGDVQAVGGVKGKDHPVRLGHVKEGGRLPAAGEGRLRRRHGGPVPAPARGGQVVHGVGAGPGHRGGLAQGGGRTIQVDHSSTSR